MTELVVRRIPFTFEDVKFLWNPANPEFSLLANVLTFQTIGFERFICKSMHEALPQITSKDIHDEIKSFTTQEMVHAQAHLKHARSIIDLYPKLQDALDESLADFDALWAARDLDFRLAYSATIEATSLPLYKVMLTHRNKMFAGGDSKVVALLIWHFCEEIEHRSSALLVYNHVVGRPWYRLRVFAEVGQHLAANMTRIVDRFAEHVPGVAALDIRRATAQIPFWARAKMVTSLLTSQLPWYRPEADRLPEYYRIWMQRYEAGEDMRFVPL